MAAVLLTGSFFTVWIGSALLLSSFRGFERPPLSERTCRVDQTDWVNDIEHWLTRQ